MTPALRPTGPSHDAAAIAPGSNFDTRKSHPPLVPSILDTTNVFKVVENAPHTDNPQSTLSKLSTALDILPLGKTSPTVVSITAGITIPASGTVSGSDKPISNVDGTALTSQKAATKTAIGSIEASDVNSAPTDRRTARLDLWLQAEDAPICIEVLQTLKKGNQEMHKVLEGLEKTKDSLLESRNRKSDELVSVGHSKTRREGGRAKVEAISTEFGCRTAYSYDDGSIGST